MALSSSSTETDAWNQYYDNVEGWRNNATKASALIAAVEWLIGRHRAGQMSIAGRNMSFESLEDLRKEIGAYMQSAATNRAPLFSRTRVQNMGGL
jgi:hypothetical protein